MKKLISTLGAITIIATSSTGVVACDSHRFDLSENYFGDDCYDAGHYADVVISTYQSGLAQWAVKNWGVNLQTAQHDIQFESFTCVNDPKYPHEAIYNWTITPDTPKSEWHKDGIWIGYLYTLKYKALSNSKILKGEYIETLKLYND